MKIQPYAYWESREFDCYVGEQDNFILPACFLWKGSKKKGYKKVFDFKPNDKYVFAPTGAGEICT